MAMPEICPVERLYDRIDYYVAREVYDLETGKVILGINCQINEGIITALKRRGIEQIFVCKEMVDVKEVEQLDPTRDIIESVKIRKVLKDSFETIAEQVASQTRFTNFARIRLTKEQVEAVKRGMEQVVQKVLENPTSCMYLAIVGNSGSYLLQHSINVAYLVLNLVTRYPDVKALLYHDEKGVSRFASGKVMDPGNLVPLGVACLLHDIGKILLFEVINKNKKYGKTDEAWKMIKEHPRIGHDMLFGKGIDAHSLLGIKYHHENFDGSGYPYGIVGDKIHIYAKLIRPIDTWDAATSHRPGMSAKSSEEVLEEMLGDFQKDYDPDILRCFVSMMLGKNVIGRS